MMQNSAFTGAVDAALQQYQTPPLPAGFTDRLMTRLAAGDLPVEAEHLNISKPRRSPLSPWRRGGTLIASVGFFGLATATAAAAGLFGEPIYMPGLSEALAKVDWVQSPPPKKAIESKKAAPEKQAKKVENSPDFSKKPAIIPKLAEPALPALTGKEAVAAAISKLRNDPEFTKLSPEERAERRRAEFKALIASGAVNKSDVRAAAQELRQKSEFRKQQKIGDPLKNKSSLTPEQQAKIAERKTARRERMQNATPEERARMKAEAIERRRLREEKRGTLQEQSPQIIEPQKQDSAPIAIPPV